MEYLIDILKSEHRLIVKLLNKLRTEGLTSSDAVQELIDARNLLLQHLKKEDEILYQVLFEGSQLDKTLGLQLKRFDKEMGKVTQKVFTYFTNYSEGKNAGNFARDTKAIYEMLKTRIVNEETILFPEYERLCSANHKKPGANEKQKITG